MNSFILHLINEISTKINWVQAIILRGSRRTDDQLDFWSDYDVLVVLKPFKQMDEVSFFQSIGHIGDIIGSEVYIKSESIMYRTAIKYDQSIKLLDVSMCTYNEWLLVESTSNISSIIYGDIELDRPIGEHKVDFSFNSYKSRIEEIWFKYFITIKKFARKDSLIGMHLLLDLVREYLVVEMIERDIQHNTNIHRHGYHERLPDNLKLSKLDETNIEGVLDYIDRLAFEYDEKLQSKITGYTSQYDHIVIYIKESKNHLK